MASANPHNAYLPGYDSVNHHELRTAESSAAYLLPVLQQKAKSNPKLTLLDVGAGPGTITAGLAAYMPEGRVTGTDISAEILARAAANATRLGIGNVSFQAADVYALPFEDGAFDVVHAHQMLLYLDSPVAALREMLRVADPAGGVVAVRNNDMGMWSWWPRLPGLQRFHEVQLATHEAAGGTNLGGVRLISWALEAGVEREKVVASMGTWSYSDALERRIWGKFGFVSGATVFAFRFTARYD